MIARRGTALGRRMKKVEVVKEEQEEPPEPEIDEELSELEPLTMMTTETVDIIETEIIDPAYMIRVEDLNSDNSEESEGNESITATEVPDEPDRRSLFQKLLTPQCVVSDGTTSEDVDEEVRPDGDDGTHGTSSSPGTYYSSSDGGEDGSETLNDSTLDGDNEASDNYSAQESTTSTERESDTSSLVAFDEGLMVRHRGACKYMRDGNYGKAIAIFQGIHKDLVEEFGEDHPRVAAALHNEAVANLRAGLMHDALEKMIEAIRIRKLTLGGAHSKVADSLVEYGIILSSMKQYDSSRQIFEEALEIRQAELEEAWDRYGRQQVKFNIAKIRHNISCVNYELGNLDEAKRNCDDAMAEQKAIFGFWIFRSLKMPRDASKPGFMTMASTMCNKGYIDLELENFKDAIAMFEESLKIQKVRLQADSRLILSTMDNIAYCRCKLREFEKASSIYNELVTLQSSSANKKSQKDWVQSLKKQIYCQIKLCQYDEAFDNLRMLEDYLQSKGDKMRNALRRTHKLMVQVNYHMFKFPTLNDYVGWVSCAPLCGGSKEGAIDAEAWSPKKPVNESKMSGQRMTYA